MSAFIDCIRSRVEAGEVSQAQLDRIDELVAKSRESGLSDADIAEMLTAQEEKLLSMRRREAALQASKVVALDEARRSYQLGEDHAGSVLQFLSPDHQDMSLVDNVWSRSQTVFRTWQSDFVDGIEALRSKRFGLKRDRALEDLVGKEIFGESTGDEFAAHIAKQWADSRSNLFDRFRRAGGRSEFNADNKMPQFHNQQRIANPRKFRKLIKRGMSPEEANAVLRAEWRDYLKPLLDRSKMIDRDTGLPFSERALDAMMDDVFESIRTGGLNKVQDTASLRRGPGRFEDAARVFWFKDFDSWRAYHDAYGDSSVFNAMVRESEARSNSIAQLEILGPQPDATVGLMANRFERALEDSRRGKSGTVVDQIKNTFNTRKYIMDVYNTVNGRSAIKTISGLAEVFGSMRAVVTSALINSAVIPSQADIARLPFARTMIGANRGNIISDVLRVYNPRSLEDKILAARKGVIMEVALGEALIEGRFVAGPDGAKVFRKLPEFAVRSSGLQTFTEKVRFVAATDFLDTVSHHIEMGRKWGEIPDELRLWLGARGFNGNDWRSLASVAMDQVVADKGTSYGFINLREVTRKNGRVGDLLHSALLEYMELVSPTSDPRVQAGLTLGTQAGSIEGEFFRTTKVFGSYPWMVAQQHLHRIQASPVLGEGAVYRRIGVFSKYFAATVVISAMAYQFREISKGRDPRSMDDWEFWANVALQSGGLSIYGDFIDSIVGENRYGDSLGQTITGPVFRQGDDALNVGRQAFLALRQKDNTFADSVIDFVEGVQPGRNNWYARLFLDRIIYENLRLAFDPKAAEKFRRAQRRLRRDTGQDFWFPPGGSPRAPRLEAAFGE